MSNKEHGEGNLEVKIPTVWQGQSHGFRQPLSSERSHACDPFGEEVPLLTLCSDISNSVRVDSAAQAKFVDSGEIVTNDESDSHLLGLEVLPGHQGSDLSKILSRPLIIYSGTWTYGAVVSQTLDPWSLFYANPVVQSVIQHFSLIRATMRVRVKLNGTPFHMGRMFIGYRPVFNAQSAWLGTAGYTNEMELSLVSQLPGTQQRPISPNKSESFEIVLPWFNRKLYANVQQAMAGNESLGLLKFMSPMVLSSANAVAIDAYYTVFASLENIELLVPVPIGVSSTSTGTFQKIAKAILTEDHSEDQPDGTISSITAAFANSMGALTKVPLIQELAIPGEAAFRNATRFAKWFGLSRPPVYTDTMYVRNQQMSHYAYTEGAETIAKLTYSPKQAITIDPSTVGLAPVDEMDLDYIKMHWSYVTQFTWLTTDAPGTSLMQVGVCPYLVNSGVRDALSDVRQFTSVAQAGVPFSYWRGGMEYLFVLAQSQYHSGRLAITYHPTGVTHFPLQSNQQYVQYCDIKDSDEFPVTVHMAQDVAYLDNPTMNTGVLFDPLGIIYNANTMNGSLQISVLNRLVAPNAAANVQILMFARGAKDLEYRAPRGDINPSNNYYQNYPFGVSSVSAGTFVGADDSMNESARLVTYFNDKVPSLRALFKRYQFHRSLQNLTAGNSSFIRTFIISFPFPYIFYKPVLWGTSYYNNNTGNIQVVTPLVTLFRGCYAGWRGAFRRKVILGSSGVVYEMSATYDPLGLSTAPATYPMVVSAGANTAPFSLNIFSSLERNGINGVYGVDGKNQRVLEFEIPFYSKYKFETCDFAQGWRDGSTQIQHLASVGIAKANQTDPNTVTETKEYVATGEDFSFLYYLGGMVVVVGD